MTVRKHFRRESEADVKEALAWYRERRLGLGDEFLRSLDSCFTAIQRLPENHPIVHRISGKPSFAAFPMASFMCMRERGCAQWVIGGFDRLIGGRLQSYQAMIVRS